MKYCKIGYYSLFLFIGTVIRENSECKSKPKEMAKISLKGQFTIYIKKVREKDNLGDISL